MLRAVLDANVFASAFIRPQGHSGQILLRLAEKREFQLVLSASILAEVRRVLRYPRLRKELRCSDEEIDLRVAALGVLADMVEEGVSVHVVKADPDDDKYIATALVGRASHLVSGDHHLLDLVDCQGVRIVRPRAFLEILNAQRSLPAGDAGPDA